MAQDTQIVLKILQQQRANIKVCSQATQCSLIVIAKIAVYELVNLTYDLRLRILLFMNQKLLKLLQEKCR